MLGSMYRPMSAQAGKVDSNVPPLFDHTLRGMGQVVFCNSALSGGLISAGLCFGDPWLGVLALTGCTTATAAAGLLAAPSANIGAGLLGYNGALVGCAFAVFLGYQAWTPEPVAATVVGAAASAGVAMTLGGVLTAVPQYTLAFNIVALSALAFVRPFSSVNPEEVAEPQGPEVMSGLDWLSSVLTGVSQIFVVNNPFSGVLILAGIAAYSPLAAVATAVGSASGVLSAVACGADMAAVKDGLWGFNPALTSLAVSIFFTPLGRAYQGLMVGGAVATALATVAFNKTLGTALEGPTLTLPFCLMASLAYLMGSRVPGLVRARAPHSPEENWRAYWAARGR